MRKLKCKEVKDLAECHAVEAGFKFREHVPESYVFKWCDILALVEAYHLVGRAWQSAIPLTLPACSAFLSLDWLLSIILNSSW